MVCVFVSKHLKSRICSGLLGNPRSLVIGAELGWQACTLFDSQLYGSHKTYNHPNVWLMWLVHRSVMTLKSIGSWNIKITFQTCKILFHFFCFYHPTKPSTIWVRQLVLCSWNLLQVETGPTNFRINQYRW